MKYGCIGEHLKHSFSKEIHNALTDYEYEIREIPKDGLDEFMRAKDFTAINVTIPYKEAVIPYLDSIDEHAQAIGAVNTIVNRNGRLFGYNTDFYGMSKLIRKAGVEIEGKKVAILGSGGTGKTAFAVATSLGAKEILRISRKHTDTTLSYDELYALHTDTEVVINTTPLGMFPDNSSKPIDASKLPKLCGVIDAVYNPLRTILVSEAQDFGIAAEGGLYMLVAQAVRASEIFTDGKFDDGELDRVFLKVMKEKENIVLIGMPSSGKSTVGKIIAERLGREFIDTDSLIVEDAREDIPTIFANRGESEFRSIERRAVCRASAKTGAVIATGGGAVLSPENVKALRQNGRIFFIDRPLETLMPTEDRPLARSADDIRALYEKRYRIYCEAADVIIKADKDAALVAEEIINESLHN